ncbi:MAG: 30S ribosomal protein S6 [Planctomycetota bacterium]
MPESVYECMFIFNANAYARNPAGAAKGIEDLVKNVDGEILASRLFDERKLAYPINGHRKGVYWLTYAKLDHSSLPKFNRAAKLSDIVLRHMVVKLDPRLVDTMVAVAQGKTPPGAEPEKTEDSPAEKEKPAEAAAKG